MNIKKIISICFLFGLIQFQVGGSQLNAKESNSWQSSLAKVKQDLRDGKFDMQATVSSDVMRFGTGPQTLVMDVSELDDIILISDPTEDGTSWDHAIYANPRLIDEDGDVVSLVDLKPKHYRATYGTPIFNETFSKGKLQIGGKVYEKGFLLHSDGIISYHLDKKYKRFEVEVGISDLVGNKTASSVVFKIQDGRLNSDFLLSKLASKEHKEAILDFASIMGQDPIDILSSSDGSVEKRAVLHAMKSFENKEFYEAKIKEYDQLSVDARLEKYIYLADLALKSKGIKEQLVGINTDAISLYLEDIKSEKGFDYTANKAKYDLLVSTLSDVKCNIERGNEEYIKKGEELLKLSRDILLSNPLLDVDKIVVSRFKMGSNARNGMAPSIGSAANNYSNMYSAARTGFDAEIAELSNLRGEVKIRTIHEPKRDVNIADLQIHWDADKLIFSSLDDKNRWQVFEVGVDGSGFKQKIKLNEPDVEFCDPNYLPDGRIIAASTAGYNAVPCVNGSDAVGNLSLYDTKDGSFRRLTFDQDNNWNPVVMNNGRVMFTRWEYTDLTHYFSRIIMHMNPDGTENKALYGSGSFWPNSTFDIKPLPGSSSKFVGVISGHHGIARSGRLMIFDPTKSRKEAEGVVQELPYRNREVIPEIKDYLVNGVWPQFIRPYPISDKYFLVSAKLTPESLWGIYLVDVFDNLTCIAEFEGEGLNSPLLVTKRATPPVIPDRVNLEDKEATIFIQDIYAGEGSMGLPRGTVKELRILAYEYAYMHGASDHDAQGIQSGWDIKRLLGTVPVEEDGSVIFTAPANTPISLQPVDSDGRAVQWMRSWFTPMPGETVSCIGCHEDQNQIPIPKRVIASERKPHKIKTPEGGARPFTFDLEIQPILDRACISCHKDGSDVNFTTRIDKKYPRFGRPWNKSYLELMPYVYRQGPEADMYVLKPYEYHASNSELVRILKTGHHGVELTDKEWRTIYNWIDFNAPYHGAFLNLPKHNNFDQYDRRIELANKYNNGAGVDWREEVKNYSEYLDSKGEVEAVMPEAPKPIKTKKTKLSSWPLSPEQAKELQAENGDIRREIEFAPGVNITFVWIPAGKFAMGSNDGQRDNAPAFKTEVKEGFWMSETEITNEQYCALFPEHDSRIIGQFWKDHTTAGYWANKPQQPVIRVSFEEAQEYCSVLTESVPNLGLKVSLPTETEWEWACRGGNDGDFWYGNSNTDFGKFENMADAKLSDMAVIGVDPKPMSKNSSLRPYWDYLPKESSVNDGAMITTEVGSYKPNVWGLKDMHGNVAEWTESDYTLYPLKSKNVSDRKVVRGGSWTDRPKYSTSYSRKAFYPWQKVYNVGFRIILTQ